ncbi:MAG: Fe-Mn family superoxide dismutase [bacterium]|nr:Fe-Mn family superoxide dismutase [bacterium]
MTYTSRIFDLPALEGISEKQVKVHLALYEGYVKHVNLIIATIAAYGHTEDEGGKYAVRELRRRLGFEFDGMRMHEYYFGQLEIGSRKPEAGSALAKAADEKYGSGTEGLIAHIKDVALTRGIGWVVVYWDAMGTGSTGLTAGTLHTIFVEDHELGQLAGLPIILALDLWEHAYMVDYVPAEKASYVESFLKNLNWSVVEKRFDITATSAA